MPLEFALRPRINLERPPTRRRLGWLRLPPLALPIAAYWLGMAGLTYTLLRLAAPESSFPTSLENAGADPVLERAVEPAPVPAEPMAAEDASAEPVAALPTAPAPEEEEPALDRALAAIAHESAPVAREPAPVARQPAPAEQRSVFARAEQPPRVSAEHRAFERPAPFQPSEEAPPRRSELPREPVDREPPRDEVPATALPSCETAAASADETMDLRRPTRRAPDLTRGAFAAVLENGSYLSRCAIPARTALEICAAVHDGKVVGVSVTTAPRDPAISACVRRAVAALRFPRSERLDVTRTRFEPTP